MKLKTRIIVGFGIEYSASSAFIFGNFVRIQVIRSLHSRAKDSSEVVYDISAGAVHSSQTAGKDYCK